MVPDPNVLRHANNAFPGPTYAQVSRLASFFSRQEELVGRIPRRLFMRTAAVSLPRRLNCLSRSYAWRGGLGTPRVGRARTKIPVGSRRG
jgi:hypothetical protein